MLRVDISSSNRDRRAGDERLRDGPRDRGAAAELGVPSGARRAARGASTCCSATRCGRRRGGHRARAAGTGPGHAGRREPCSGSDVVPVAAWRRGMAAAAETWPPSGTTWWLTSASGPVPSRRYPGTTWGRPRRRVGHRAALRGADQRVGQRAGRRRVPPPGQPTVHHPWSAMWWGTHGPGGGVPGRGPRGRAEAAGRASPQDDPVTQSPPAPRRPIAVTTAPISGSAGPARRPAATPRSWPDPRRSQQRPRPPAQQASPSPPPTCSASTGYRPPTPARRRPLRTPQRW